MGEIHNRAGANYMRPFKLRDPLVDPNEILLRTVRENSALESQITSLREDIEFLRNKTVSLEQKLENVSSFIMQIGMTSKEIVKSKTTINKKRDAGKRQQQKKATINRKKRVHPTRKE